MQDTNAATRCQTCIAADVKTCEHIAVKRRVVSTAEAAPTFDRDSLATLVEGMEVVPGQTEHQWGPEGEDDIESWEEWRNVINAVQDTGPQSPAQVPPVSVLNRKRGQNL
jgi:hypothetical protein